MSGQMTLADAYDLVYSAASRMMWAQQNLVWRLDQKQPDWPEERRRAWRELEEALRASERGAAPQQGEPSDPARHLISRRAAGPVDRPLSFEETVEEWKARLAEDPGPYEARTEPVADDYLVPGRAVVIPEGHMLTLTNPIEELAHRLAPGRPPVTISADTSELSRLAHAAADRLRGALGRSVPTPHPSDAVPVAQVSHRPSDGENVQERYDVLSRAAWRAAESVPTLEELKGAMDFSVTAAAATAAQDLRDLLSGKSGLYWREEHESIDPRVHEVWAVNWSDGQGVPEPLASGSSAFRRNEEAGRLPSAPGPQQRRFYREAKGEVEYVAISAVRAEILAEILDEYAARIHPGATSGFIHFSALDLTDFITRGIGRELRATVGF